MSLDERQIGEVLGEVKQISQRISELGRTTADIQREVQGLADVKARQDEHHKRIDSLEADRDQRKGMVQLVRFAQGLALAGIGVASYLVGAGHG